MLLGVIVFEHFWIHEVRQVIRHFQACIELLLEVFESVIEINGRDRPGLLHDITSALTNLGLQISSALITTYGERAVDVFYVKDGFGMQITHEGRIGQIRDRLLEVLRDGQLEDGLEKAAVA